MKGSLLMPRVEAHMDMVFKNTHILCKHKLLFWMRLIVWQP